MDWIHQLLSRHGWTVWKIVGWIGNTIFASRFLVQWYATEKRRRVSVPASFWWLSLAGALVMLCYAAFGLHDWIIIFAYAFTWIPYIRNLVIHYRHERAQRACAECGVTSPPSANFCSHCGAKLESAPTAVPL
jgi:lipid-A-disaccharide synthase-like uncharacterized protein